MNENPPEENSVDILKDDTGNSNSQDSLIKTFKRYMKNIKKVKLKYLTGPSVPTQPIEILIKQIKKWTP